MSYKLQPISCTNTVHTHNGNYVINLSHYPRSPTHSTHYSITHSNSLLTATHTAKNRPLCNFTNLYRSRWCIFTNTKSFVHFDEKSVLPTSLHILVVPTFVTQSVRFPDPSDLFFEFLFFIITFFIIL